MVVRKMTAHATATAVVPPAFVRLLNFCFRELGLFVADYDKLVVVVVLFFTIFTSAKIAFTPQQDDIRTGYTPNGARSRSEIAVYSEYFESKGDPIMVFAIVVAKDGGSMARLEYMEEAVKQLDFVTTNVTYDGHTFFTLCSDFCQVNEPIRHFYNGLVMRNKSARIQDHFTVTFPIMNVLGKDLDLSPNFFGVRTNKTDDTVEFLRVVAYTLRANPPSNWTKYDLQAYERLVSAYFHTEMKSDLLEVYCFSLTYTSDEIVRTGLTIFPYLAVGFVVMTIFSVVTVYYSSSRMNQWSNYKIIDAIFGCICPLLATSSALGFLFWCGFRFASILFVTPFLVLAIGVDDAYLMMHSWMRFSVKDPTMTKRERVAHMLVDVGPSVTITSLTNFFAFLVGYYTPTPEIQVFCFGNAVAILFDFLYQITIFAALLSIVGDLQMRENSKSNKVRQWNDLKVEKFSFILDEYSQWLANKFTAVFLFIILCCYWFISIVGALQIEMNLTADKLVLQDSRLIKMNYYREQFILVNYTIANIFIQNPGNLNDPERLDMVNRLIESFESYPECLGANFSHYFVRDYKFYRETVELEEEKSFGITEDPADIFTQKAMQPFFSWPEFKHWNGFVKFDDHGKLYRIYATVSYHGELMGDNVFRKSLLERWRDTADSFADLNVSMFDDYAPFLDQLDSMLPATISTSICTLVCMMIVCFLFMYNLFTVLVATLSIISICIGVFGLLSFWSIDLDPISMATTIMSIGFSVDFPAHITFHYFREGMEDPDSTPARRVAKSLSAIGFPLLQCGLSTILFVLCLLFVRTYMSEVFVKTMVLVVTLGLIHGLVLVPAFLCALTSIFNEFFKNRFWGSQSSITEWFSRRDSRPSSEGKASDPPTSH
uniref:SSD domain-containing protein n=1 Tax=Haemonchus contortus TaxID=6289 RepID=A0A7I4YSX6_HAECO